MTHLTADQIADLKSETATSFWQDWRVDLLKAAHEDSKSAGQIAEELGCTRNMVISKMRRVAGLEPHAKPRLAARKPRVHQKPIFGRVVEPVEAVDIPLPSIEDAARDRASLKTLVELEPGECKWPVNDGSPYLFCSDPIAGEHTPYCAAHHRRSVNPHAYRNALRPYIPGRAR